MNTKEEEDKREKNRAHAKKSRENKKRTLEKIYNTCEKLQKQFDKIREENQRLHEENERFHKENEVLKTKYNTDITESLDDNLTIVLLPHTDVPDIKQSLDTILLSLDTTPY
jgi:hypothetical protein